MTDEMILLLLFAGVPYYLFFEKTKLLRKQGIFLFAVALMIYGMVKVHYAPFSFSTPMVIVAFIASLFSLYKAHKTNNLYKLSYYILFFNAPLLVLFGTKEAILYGVSLLVSLMGVYLMGRYYERNYGSANYQSVGGIILKAPFAGFFMTIYLTTLALYPPFPNALLFLNGILNTQINLLWYLIVVVIFFGNFLIAVRVMAKTVFGKPNDNVHYLEITLFNRLLHFAITILLLALSVVGLGELL